MMNYVLRMMNYVLRIMNLQVVLKWTVQKGVAVVPRSANPAHIQVR